MSWPTGDGSPDDAAQAGQPSGGSGTDSNPLAGLGTLPPSGRLKWFDFTREHQERALRLMGVPFESLPKVPFLSPLFGYTTSWQKMRVAMALTETSLGLRRPVTPEEADAIAFHQAKYCSRVAWTPFLTLATTALFTFSRVNRTGFRFPLYRPKPSFDPSYFPSPRRPHLRGAQAVRAWHAVRFGAYGFVAYVFTGMFLDSFAHWSFVAGMFRDPRLDAVREGLLDSRHSKGVAAKRRKDLEQLGELPMTIRVNRPPSGVTELQDELVKEQLRMEQAAVSRAPQAAPQDDDSFLFDDASPVAPSQQRPRPPTSTQGQNSWASVRMKARLEASEWNRAAQQSGEAPESQNKTERYTYAPDEQAAGPSKEQAQKEFDAMLERERRGEGNEGRRR